MAATNAHVSIQNGRNRVFQIACSGHSMNMTPMTSASTTSTSVDRRRYQPAATIATPASSHIHHGNHSVGEKCLTGFALVSSGPRNKALQKPSTVCRTGPGSGIHDGSSHFARGRSLEYRMLCVYFCCHSSGSNQTALNAPATAPTGIAIAHVRCGRRVSHSNMAAMLMKIATTMCDMIASAISVAGSQRRFPVSSVYASAPSPNNANAEADRERELTREGARDVAAVDLPVVARLHERPQRGDRERGRRGPGRLHALGERVRGRGEHERAAHRHELERDVVRHHDVEHPDHQRRNREVVLADREPGVPVGRPTRQAELREPVVGEELGPPHVRAHVAAVGGRVAEQIAELELGRVQRPVMGRVDDREDDERADRDDRPTDRALPERARLIILVEG